jgi:1-acyl-sn-glycerol-3-phosphate acyltransferase
MRYIRIMLSKISHWLLKLWGFKFTGYMERFPKRVMFVIMPHTSNWDFPLGVLIRSALKLKLNYIGKSSLFKWPYGFIFRWLGGIPVDRSKSSNFVESVVDSIAHMEDLSLAMSPEGTRKRVDKLKSGFYWIAIGAKMPLVFVKFDYGNKEINFAAPYIPTGDYDSDLKIIENHFKGVAGKIPEYGYNYELSK